jgi:nucleotide-binding universal stress UspA family protein
MPILKILAATDFSSDSEAALTLALDLARRYGASVTLLHVCQVPMPAYFGGGAYVPSPGQIEDVVRDAAKQLAAARDQAATGDVVVDTHTRVGDAASEIVRHASEHGYDMIVVGTHGRRGFRRFVLGSVAELVVRTAHVPVLTTRSVAPSQTAARAI